MNNIEKQIDKITMPDSNDLIAIDLALRYWKYNQLPTKKQFKKFMKDVKSIKGLHFE